MQEVKLRVEAKYENHSIKKNRNVDVQFKMSYTELTNYIQSLQMLNEDVTVGARIGSGKPIKLGTFNINMLKIDGDGEGTIKFNSQLDFIEGDLLNKLASNTDQPLVLLLKCQIDLEDEDDE